MKAPLECRGLFRMRNNIRYSESSVIPSQWLSLPRLGPEAVHTISTSGIIPGSLIMTAAHGGSTAARHARNILLDDSA